MGFLLVGAAELIEGARDREVSMDDAIETIDFWIDLEDGRRMAARRWTPVAPVTKAPAVLEYLPYRLDDGTAPAPFAEASFIYALQAADEVTTRVETTLRFTLRGGLLGEWLGRALLGSVFQQRVDEVAVRLKAFYETP